ncbi:hypothetical protein FRC08_003170 [Ceratobasidium sp. 394]|nr:hypothetical protein FRC08_003170 [Ceratobasidium sp. 394]
MSNATMSALVFATASHYELMLRLLAALTFPSITDLEKSIPRISEAEYLAMVRILAPERDPREVDAELTTLHRTYIDSLGRKIDALSERVERQSEIFFAFVSNYDSQFPHGQTDANGNRVPEPELVASSRLGIQIAHTIHVYVTDLYLGPRDSLRTKLTYLIAQSLLETGAMDESEPTEQQTPLESICQAFNRFNLTNDFGWTTAYSNINTMIAHNPHRSDNEMDSTDNDTDTTDADVDTTNDNFNSSDSDIGPAENITAE